MKINFKHVATAALAVAMSLSLASPALAEGPEATPTPMTSGDLTVTGHELTGKNVFAVRMFTARAFDGTEEGPNYSYDSYTLEAKWEGFFKDTTYMTEAEWEEAGVIDGDGEITDYSEAALKYLEWLAKEENSNKVPAFAEDAQDWLYEQGVIEVTGEPENWVVSIAAGWSDLAAMETATEVKPVEVNEAPSGNATFESLTSGYYVVFPEGGSTGISNRGTDAMLINIPTDHAGATWNIKSTFPTVDKKVDTNITDNDNHDDATDNGSAQVGDTVTFTLKSTVPDMSDYDEFYFAFNDTLSSGLEFVKEGETAAKSDVTVTIDGKAVTAGYSVSLEDRLLKVVFNDLTTVKAGEGEGTSVAAGDEIVVTYQAMITEAAATTNTATNTVEVEYSNNPKEETTGTSTPDESTVYTYEIDVHKWSAENGGNDAYLEGAVFALSKESNLGTLSISKAEGDTNVEVVNDKGVSVESSLIGLTGSANAYKIDPESNVYTFATTGSGAIKIQGLEAGTYYLYEVTAPTGYNKLKAPIKVEVIVDPVKANERFDDDDPNKYDEVSFTNPLYVVNGTANANANDATIKVENKKGIELPETGSIGTIGLTVAGVAIVLLGVFAPRKKKKGNQE